MNQPTLNEGNALAKSEEYINQIPPYPQTFSGRGIVICAGGIRYFTNAWVCINMLRWLKCNLPIQLWHLGPAEMSKEMCQLTSGLGVECVDACEVRKIHPSRILNGWELKPYAIKHCPFKEVILLDADNVAVINPEFLFETPQFKQHGAIFWPDYGRLGPDRSIWGYSGVQYRDEPEFETAQIVIDKYMCWQALCLCMWYNEHSDFYYRHIHGDKETFHIAFRKISKSYAMPDRPIYSLQGTMCQHDFKGNRVFQHRNMEKWNLSANNKITDFLFEQQCLDFIEVLKEKWAETNNKTKSDAEKTIIRRLSNRRFNYRRVGFDERKMEFLGNGLIGKGGDTCETYWSIKIEAGLPLLEIFGDTRLTCRLKENDNGTWTGKWEHSEEMPVELIPSDNMAAAKTPT